MTEQEKFYKTMRELIEAIFIGFGAAVLLIIGTIVWVVIT